MNITDQLPPRSLAFALLATLGLALIGGYLYVVKNPAAALAAAREQLANTRSSEPAMNTAHGRAAEMAALETAISALRERLYGNSDVGSADQRAAWIIGELDHLARARGVDLVSVNPGAPVRIRDFEEMPFEIEVMGPYEPLLAWLTALEDRLGVLTVKAFEFAPADEPMRRLRLNMVSYRCPGDAV